MQAPGLARYRRELDDYLRSLLAGEDPPVLYRMIRYHLGWEDSEGRSSEHRGKAIRPTLCLLACEATGGDWRVALPAAAAVELVHNFSLIHDDIQDRDRERRHRPTVWAVWGEGQAINAGDALLALARLAVLGLQAPAETVVEAARILDKRTLEMVEGQVMDMGSENSLDVDVASYMVMIEKKTGALFDCSLRLGALCAGAPDEVVEAMGRCGRLLGVAFQVRDDALGVWGAAERTGKPPATDIRRRKKSLPVVYTLSAATVGAIAELRRVYEKTQLTDDDVSLVLRGLEDGGAQAYCARVAQERMREAVAVLDSLELKSGAAGELRRTAAFLLERDF